MMLCTTTVHVSPVLGSDGGQLEDGKGGEGRREMEMSCSQEWG